jgi:type III secretion system YscJ/HrcJ family lipoprotein
MRAAAQRAAVLVLCLALSACQQELLKGLDQGQANEVLATLQRYNIPAHKQDAGKTGYTVRVDAEDFPAAVDLLKTYDLPSKKSVQVADFFPADALVSSPVAEKARLYSALEQRLEQSLKSFDNVVSARAHISYPLDGSAKAPVHVSVLISYQKQMDAQLFVAEVKRFLKNGLDGIEYENISVVLSQATPAQYARPVTTWPLWGWWLVALAVLLASTAGGGVWWWLLWRRAHPAQE